MQDPIFNEAQKAEIKNIMHDALNEYFTDKGKWGKNLIIGTAVIVGSLTVILGGVKAIAAWVGLGFITK